MPRLRSMTEWGSTRKTSNLPAVPIDKHLQDLAWKGLSDSTSGLGAPFHRFSISTEKRFLPNTTQCLWLEGIADPTTISPPRSPSHLRHGLFLLGWRKWQPDLVYSPNLYGRISNAYDPPLQLLSPCPTLLRKHRKDIMCPKSKPRAHRKSFLTRLRSQGMRMRKSL